MKNFNKSVILPVLMFLAFVLKQFFGVDIPDETIDNFADGLVNLVMIIFTIWGIFKNHKKENKEKE